MLVNIIMVVCHYAQIVALLLTFLGEEVWQVSLPPSIIFAHVLSLLDIGISWHSLSAEVHVCARHSLLLNHQHFFSLYHRFDEREWINSSGK